MNNSLKITPKILKVVNEAIESAIQYEKITGRKLGITGEIAEVLISYRLGLELLIDPINPGFDAVHNGRTYQIKSKRSNSLNGRMSRFSEHACDYVILGIFDPKYKLTYLYKVPYNKVLPLIVNEKRRNPPLRRFIEIAGKPIYESRKS